MTHRQLTLQESHNEYCPGPCPGIHRCVQIVLYGKNVCTVQRMTKNKPVNHNAEVRMLVLQQRRRLQDERKQAERDAIHARNEQQQQHRLAASQKLGSLFSLLEQRRGAEANDTGFRAPISDTELGTVLAMCKEIAGNMADDVTAVDGQVYIVDRHCYTPPLTFLLASGPLGPTSSFQ